MSNEWEQGSGTSPATAGRDFGSGGNNLAALRRPLVVLAAIATAIAFKYTASVLVPLAFALLAVLSTYPLFAYLKRRSNGGLALLACFVVVASVLTAVVMMIVACFDRVLDTAGTWSELLAAVKGWMPQWMLDASSQGAQGLRKEGLKALGGGLEAITGLVLALAFFALGLADADRLARAFSNGRNTETIRAAAADIARNFRRYLWARTVVGLITGAVVALGCWIIDVRLALVWGALNFLLNYIPTLGSILAVVPPFLFVLTTQDPYSALLVLAVVGGVQLVMGNYIDPLLQGRFVELTPFAVLLSVVFWGWVWGIPGAFVGVPMTLLVALVGARVPRYRWAYIFLTRSEE